MWPLVFVALARTRLTHRRDRQAARRRRGRRRWCWSFWLHAGGPGPARRVRRRRPHQLHVPVDVHPGRRPAARRRGGVRVAAVAAAAPPAPATARPARSTSPAAWRSACSPASPSVAALTDGYVYQWLLPLVSVARRSSPCSSPSTRRRVGIRAAARWPPLVAVGKRSYGLYLWHWPIFVLVGATDGVGRPVRRRRSVVTVVVTELSLPLRRDAGAAAARFGRWWRTAGPSVGRPLLAATRARSLVLAGCYVAVDPFDRAAGGADGDVRARRRAGAVARPRPRRPATAAAAAGADRRAGGHRRRLAGPLLAVNLPDGIETTFDVTDGVARRVQRLRRRPRRTARATASTTRSRCAPGWAGDVGRRGRRCRRRVALVVLGAWDVFDLETADGTRAGVRHAGVGRLRADQPAVGHRRARRGRRPRRAARGAVHAPDDVEGAGVPPLPERGDDARVAHVNDLFRAVAAANAGDVTFVEGPTSGAPTRRRHRPRHALGRRARLQARRQADLRHHRPGSAWRRRPALVRPCRPGHEVTPPVDTRCYPLVT